MKKRLLFIFCFVFTRLLFAQGTYEQSNDTIYEVTKVTLLVNAPWNFSDRLSDRIIESLTMTGTAVDTVLIEEPMQFPLGILFHNRVKFLYRYHTQHQAIYITKSKVRVLEDYLPSIGTLIVFGIALLLQLGNIFVNRNSQISFQKRGWWLKVGDFLRLFMFGIIIAMVELVTYVYPDPLFPLVHTLNAFGAVVLVEFGFFLPLVLFLKNRKLAAW